MYVVIKYFTDIKDDNYAYHAGDIFPREGVVVRKRRINELASNKNKRGVPLIEYVEDGDL